MATDYGSHQHKRQWRLQGIALSLAILLGTGALILAQERNGAVSGTVIDSLSQAPLSGVKV